ncbi:CHAT domain-containing protein [Streptomyces sp. NPDC006872]|uniref:CHAT domain-containing protein n=1 Tax=Streptomyces sp. NPDC006872 TaxID=3155720 RepID=UPI0033CEE452
MNHSGSQLTSSQRRRFLLLLDLAATKLRDALSQTESSDLAELRRRLRARKKGTDAAVVSSLWLLSARAAERGYSDLAAYLYQGLVEVVPGEADFWYNLGNQWARSGEKDRALKAYDEALRLNPAFTWALFNRGCLQYDRKAYEAAVSDFLDAARHGCDLEQFAYSVLRRLVPLRGFVTALDMVSDPSLPERMRGRFAGALGEVIDEARELDGWFLSRWPGTARTAHDHAATLVIRAVLADVLRDSPRAPGLFFGRDHERYDVRELDESDLRESLWYFPPEGPSAPPDRTEQLAVLRETLASSTLTASEATWALHYASGAIALSLLMDGANDWPTPVLRLAVPGRTVEGGRRADEEARVGLEEWISSNDGTSVTDFALGHFRSASDALTTLILSHREPDSHVIMLMGDDGPLLTDQGDVVTRPGSLHLAQALWWHVEPVYREWVLAAAYTDRAEERLAALCHARRFNALAATELWSQLAPERWRRYRAQIAALHDAHICLADIQAALGEEAALVDQYTYEVFGESISGLTLTSRDSAVKTHEVNVIGGELRALFDAGMASLFPAAGLPPAVGQPLLLPSGPIPKTLLIVPYGYLRKIPVHSLPLVLQAVDDGTLERIVYLPTASFAGRPHLPATRPRRILFIGHDPAGDIDYAHDLAALRAYGGDVTAVLGQEATCSRVQAELPHHDLVHFACHGDMDAHLAAGYLSLAGGRLYPWDVLEGAVPETVVMNSCLGLSTERFEATSDGAVGLHDAFLAAGARSVIGSMWALPEWTGRTFADIFYRRLATGEDSPQAVISTQRELRSLTKDPFYWAAHACFGAWRS